MSMTHEVTKVDIFIRFNLRCKPEFYPHLLGNFLQLYTYSKFSTSFHFAVIFFGLPIFLIPSPLRLHVFSLLPTTKYRERERERRRRRREREISYGWGAGGNS